MSLASLSGSPNGAILGFARAGSSGENGSGDYVIAFSTTNQFPAQSSGEASAGASRLSEDQLSPLFEATIEGTEEAIDDSVLRANTIRGRYGHVALTTPIDKLRDVMRRYGR